MWDSNACAIGRSNGCESLAGVLLLLLHSAGMPGLSGIPALYWIVEPSRCSKHDEPQAEGSARPWLSPAQRLVAGRDAYTLRFKVLAACSRLDHVQGQLIHRSMSHLLL